MPRNWLWIGAAALALTVVAVPNLGVGGGQVVAFLLLLLCPLMHLLGGHRHGTGGAARSDGSKPDAQAAREPGHQA
jgi:hypothetical protein